jgi:hypothetical protein
MPTNGGPPDLATISSFFGAKSDGNGGWTHVPERIPDNWFSRATPYTGVDVTEEILAQYLANPVAFGGNVGKGNFVGLDFGPIKNGQWSPTSAADVGCLLQQAVLAAVPQTIQGCKSIFPIHQTIPDIDSDHRPSICFAGYRRQDQSDLCPRFRMSRCIGFIIEPAIDLQCRPSSSMSVTKDKRKEKM